MKVRKFSSPNGHGGTDLNFEFKDDHGRVVWTGTGFAYVSSRDDAIKVARLQLSGQRPRAMDRAITTGGCRYAVGYFVARNWPEPAP